MQGGDRAAAVVLPRLSTASQGNSQHERQEQPLSPPVLPGLPVERLPSPDKAQWQAVTEAGAGSGASGAVAAVGPPQVAVAAVAAKAGSSYVGDDLISRVQAAARTSGTQLAGPPAPSPPPAPPAAAAAAMPADTVVVRGLSLLSQGRGSGEGASRSPSNRAASGAPSSWGMPTAALSVAAPLGRPPRPPSTANKPAGSGSSSKGSQPPPPAPAECWSGKKKAAVAAAAVILLAAIAVGVAVGVTQATNSSGSDDASVTVTGSGSAAGSPLPPRSPSPPPLPSPAAVRSPPPAPRPLLTWPPPPPSPPVASPPVSPPADAAQAQPSPTWLPPGAVALLSDGFQGGALNTSVWESETSPPVEARDQQQLQVGWWVGVAVAGRGAYLRRRVGRRWLLRIGMGWRSPLVEDWGQQQLQVARGGWMGGWVEGWMGGWMDG